MASEPTDGGTASAGLPDDLDAWLDARADELGLDREELFRRLLSAYQVAATAGDEEFVPAGETAALERRLDRLEQQHRESLDDVRKRVVQVKNIAERRAPSDHEHEAFDRLDERVTALAERIEALDATATQGGERAAPSGAALDDVQTKLSTVAHALVALRRKVNALDEAVDGADPVESAMDGQASERLLRLKRLAAREGYETATCATCGEDAHVSLLPEPACPHCREPIHDIVDQGTLRTKPTLVGDEERGE
ncbi:hypothetical protein [Halorarius litoreus]|uniref:hypothetical protein n=1 Tax=Halorarius litoreus TaxID=2962676 RepID=UPI0020CEF22B|nr:hypothetical protein [Halorarius litoreus]